MNQGSISWTPTTQPNERDQTHMRGPVPQDGAPDSTMASGLDLWSMWLLHQLPSVVHGKHSWSPHPTPTAPAQGGPRGCRRTRIGGLPFLAARRPRQQHGPRGALAQCPMRCDVLVWAVRCFCACARVRVCWRWAVLVRLPRRNAVCACALCGLICVLCCVVLCCVVLCCVCGCLRVLCAVLARVW